MPVVLVLSACIPRQPELGTPSTDVPVTSSSQPITGTITSRKTWNITRTPAPQAYVSNIRVSVELQTPTEILRDSLVSITDFTISRTQSSNTVAFIGSIDSTAVTPGRVIGRSISTNSPPLTFGGRLENGHLQLDSTSRGPTQGSGAECDSSIAPFLPAIEPIVLAVPAQLNHEMTWTDSVSISSCQGSIPITLTRIHTYHVRGEQSLDGRLLLLLDRTDKNTAAGEGAQGQHWLTVQAQGTGSAQLQLDPSTGALFHSDGHHVDTVLITTSGRIQKFTQTTRETLSQIQ